MGVVSDVIFMRYHDNGIAFVVKFLEKVHDTIRSFRIQVTSGFISKYN